MAALAPADPSPRRLDTRNPFLRADALAAGITPKQLRGPRFRRLFTGVYIAAGGAPLPVQGVQAALLIHPPAAFASHASAARVYDAPLPAGLADEHVSVFAENDRRRRRGVRCHVADRRAPVATYRTLRLSAPEQCFVELASQLSLVDLVVVGDYFVRKKWITPQQLVAHANGPLGNPAAARAAGYVRDGVDSPMETRLRMLIVLAGLPEPTVDFTLFQADGRVRYHFDLSYPDLKLVVEYDGRQHRDDLDQWDHDIARGEWLDDEGWHHVPVFSRGIYRRPDQTLARVVKALKKQGCRDLPSRLNDDWRPYFPVRP